MRLDSGHGFVDLGFAGKGMLDNGFAGTARVAASRLDLAGCAMLGLSGTVKLHIRRARPDLAGPLAAARLDCGTIRADRPQVALKAILSEGLDSWNGTARVNLAALSMPQRRVSDVTGDVSFAGGVSGTHGKIALGTGRFAMPEAAGGQLQLRGDYAQRSGGFEYRGRVAAGSAGLSQALLDKVRGTAAAAHGTPLGPVVAQIAGAAATAAAAFDASADLVLAVSPTGMHYRLPRLEVAAANGARFSFDRGSGVRGDGSGTAPRIDGSLALRGGGMPEALVRLSQKPGDARLYGVGFVQPYAAGGSSLALSNVVFVLGESSGTMRTFATLSGPFAGGRIDRLALPLDARWRGGSITLNPGCVPVRFERIAAAGAVLAPGGVTACPLGSAMLHTGPDGVGGGIRLVRPDLSGQVGSSPLTLRAAEARLDLGTRRFGVTEAAVRLGTESVTRLDIGTLSGRFGQVIGGDFADLGGQIGTVPLVISGGAGTWKADDAGLSLAGKLQVADTAAPVRFHPLASDDAMLRLVGNDIVATAGLKTPAAGVPVGRVEIRHDLSTGKGVATIAVPGLRFAEGGLQPSDLTPLTFGVIADVGGSVEGEGRIQWSPEAVTSTGRFGTRATDLAAAFGSVRGLATEVRFSDLLNMRTEPGQVATIAEVNPGAPVTSGTIRFRLLDSQRVEVEGGRWPFAGGELVLEPTILDFSQSRERRMTFRVIGADAALFLKEMAFENLDATGTFDGTLPMVFDEKGGRIEGGSLRARAGGSIAYVGEISQRDVGFWGNMAFQALKALDYRSLTIDMNGPLAGDMVTEIRFAGVSQGKGTKSISCCGGWPSCPSCSTSGSAPPSSNCSIRCNPGTIRTG
ncbi:YdbH domain-containing protein [Sphingomonas sp. 7/4-4]|uniref:intermembrane phospholipid transport protein YdbH family protein n=1 Tax=Sphingomonas sp. 7/4-4 TaxID=3018446 RepID=UPI0022F38D8B|nr:YdbH domain-containing protein [Sphingomonas sp. 7/4-4]WBY06765.1 YdbH domain-containing protein [Sphingomonas sp. 7/4-4]